MILVVDIGNSNIVVGLAENSNIKHTFRMVTNRHKTSYEYSILLASFLKLKNVSINDLSGGIISSVVPELTNTIKNAIQNSFHIKVFVVGKDVPVELKVNMDYPEQMGSDLITDAVAAISEYKLPLIVFDLGTATTCFVINRKGIYIGGFIYPGVKISMDALIKRASQLPNISYDSPAKLIGKNTIDCMKSGAVL